MSIKEFIEEARVDIQTENQQDNYCIILYSVHGSGIANESLRVRCVYKSLEDFEKRVEAEIEKIDPMFGIRFHLWFFD